jgi:DNA-binding NtrC family response regulator
MPGPISSEGHVLAYGDAGDHDPGGRTIPKRLLVIDDQIQICIAIVRASAALGLDIRTIQDPLKATEAYIDFAPDVVLLDMVMPEKDGVDVLHEMLLIGPPTKFILMSGYGISYMHMARAAAAFHGVEQPAILSKPFRQVVLVDLLRTTLSMNPASAA